VTDQDKSTVTELAELIADQSEELRNLRRESDEQNDIIVEYELDKDLAERIDSDIYSELEAALNIGTLKGTRTAIQSILDNYFGDFA